MKNIKSLLALFLLVAITSCYQSRETSKNATYSLPIKVEKKPEKEGKSCKMYITLISNFISSHDLSVESARIKGGISEIVSIEEDKIIVLPFFVRTCTIVKGN